MFFSATIFKMRGGGGRKKVLNSNGYLMVMPCRTFRSIKSRVFVLDARGNFLFLKKLNGLKFPLIV